MPTRYVLAVGGTDSAETAREWAAAHAASDGVPLVTVHVDRPGQDLGPLVRDGMTTIKGESAPDALARFVADDDVLVIGSGKTGFIHSRVYGTRGLQIAAAVPCSVAVIPEVDLRFRSGVVAGIVDGDDATQVVDAAAGEAASRAEPLLLVHSTFEGLIPGAVETEGPVLARALATATSRWPSLSIRSRTSERRPAEALLDASRNCALLVLGASARHALGSVAHDVLINLNAPVLIVRRPQRS